MRRFDESRITAALEGLPTAFRVLFAAACAERQMAAYRRFRAERGCRTPNALERALEEVWEQPIASKTAAILEADIEEVMALIPQEDGAEGAWTQESTNAQNAGMAVVYALRTRLTGEAQEAAWAARVAYEALDNFVINTENIDTNEPGQELRVLAHPLLQGEFERQERDLDELRAVDVRELAEVTQRFRDRAKAEAALFGVRPHEPRTR